MYNKNIHMKKGFTLIELLAVIAVILILSVVVILAINPSELLKQGRDVTRISDMSTLNKAISLYYQDAMSNPTTLFMGTSSVIYVSVPDPQATSTAGNQCQGLGLPTAPNGFSYQCAPSSTYTKTDGTGWIPINFNSYLSGQGGSVISKLPVDPTNTTSTNLYYTYGADGIGGFKVASFLESQKDASQMEKDSGGDSELYEKGSNLTLASGRGLAGYWPLNEGTGSTTIDWSGNGDPGTWSGTQSGASGYYSAGHIWSSAGTFDGTDDKISVPDAPALDFSNDFTVFLWFRTSTTTYSTGGAMLSKRGGASQTVGYQIQTSLTNGSPSVLVGDATGYSSPSLSAAYNVFDMNWHNVILERAGSNILIYLDGALIYSGVTTHTGSVASTGTLYIGSYGNGTYFPGTISDVRLYDYALPVAEIQTMYNAGK